MPVTSDHPLSAVLGAAAIGSFPPVDGLVEVMSPDRSGARAIVEFTGHAYVLTGRDPGDPVFDGIDAFGGVTRPHVVTELADGGPVGSHDLVMVRRGGAAAPPLSTTTAYDDHPRVRRARHHRDEVEVRGDERGLVTIGTGLVGRTELSVEVVNSGHSAGAGRALILGGLASVPEHTFVFAQVAPGNAASVRAFLACDFTPIGSEILLGPTSPPPAV